MEIMNNDGLYVGDVVAIVHDSYHLACEFSSIVFKFCPGELNVVAHELARIARSSCCNEWLDNAPYELVPLLLKDVSLILNE
jgi:hypothetical protein